MGSREDREGKKGAKMLICAAGNIVFSTSEQKGA
jgi:hypothetical protein